MVSENVEVEEIEPEDPIEIEPVYPEMVTVYDNISILETNRFDLNNSGILTQEFLDDHNESISFNFAGTILLNNDLTFNNTLILSNDQEDDLVLDCQGHSITFDFSAGNQSAIWVENSNLVRNCDVISDFSEEISYNNTSGIVLVDSSSGFNCVVKNDIIANEEFIFRRGFWIIDESHSEQSISKRNYTGFVLYDNAFSENCIARYNHESGFKLSNESSLNDCSAGPANDIGFELYDSSYVEDSEAKQNNDIGFELQNNSVAENCYANDNGTGVKLAQVSSSQLINSEVAHNDSTGIFIYQGTQIINNVEVRANGFYDPITGEGAAGIEVYQNGNFENPEVQVILSNSDVHDNDVGAFLGGTLTTDSAFCGNEYIDLVEYGITYENTPTINLDVLYPISHYGTRNIVSCNGLTNSISKLNIVNSSNK